MIYFQAVIDVKPGKLRDFSRLMEQELAPYLSKAGMKLIGSWTNITDKVNEVTDLWAFESLEAYGRVFASFIRDPEYLNIDGRLRELITSETIKLMSPLPCSPLK